LYFGGSAVQVGMTCGFIPVAPQLGIIPLLPPGP
jgi:hypothetical protein